MYDINPIKKVEQSVKSDTITTDNSISQNPASIKRKDKVLNLLFKMHYSDGTLMSFDLVSNKEHSIVLQALYMDRADYQKKSAETLLMKNAASNTPKTQVGQTSNNNISQDDGSVKRKLSNRSTDSISNHSLLANALESAAQNDVEE